MKLIDKRTDKTPNSDCYITVTVMQDGKLAYDHLDVDWELEKLFTYEGLVGELLDFYNYGTDQVKRITLFSGGMGRKTLTEVLDENDNVSIDDFLRNMVTRHNNGLAPLHKLGKNHG